MKGFFQPIEREIECSNVVSCDNFKRGTDGVVVAADSVVVVVVGDGVSVATRVFVNGLIICREGNVMSINIPRLGSIDVLIWKDDNAVVKTGGCNIC